MMSKYAVWVHPMSVSWGDTHVPALDAASSSSFELPVSSLLREDELSVLEVQWLEYVVKLGGVWEEETAGLVGLHWLNE